MSAREGSAELKRILLAEDDDAIRMIAAMALELGGMHVVQCASGIEALRAIPASDAQMAVLDVMMPGMNGLETLARLREDPATAGLPVVFLTARIMPQDIADYRARGVAHVIFKPFDSATLAGQLRAVWARHGAHQARP